MHFIVLSDLKAVLWTSQQPSAIILHDHIMQLQSNEIVLSLAIELSFPYLFWYSHLVLSNCKTPYNIFSFIDRDTCSLTFGSWHTQWLRQCLQVAVSVIHD